MNWIKTEEETPEYEENVLVFCKIYGRYLAYYEQIDNSDFGQWCSFSGEKGLLPPTHWSRLPDPPLFN